MKTLPFLLLVILVGCAKDPFLTDNSGTFKDSRDQHEYKWVRIGEQIWMAENLAWLPAVSPSSDASDTVPRYYVYDYEGTSASAAKENSNYTTYGVLYNWEAAKTACSEGWRLPSDEDWKVLEKYLGMSEDDANFSEYYRDSGSVGGKLKEAGTSHWESPNTGAVNSSGFTALPGGGRDGYDGFNCLGGYAFFWSSSESSSSYARGRGLYYGSDGVGRGGHDCRLGFSVRCIKDE
jgi:uncharacterized protein (TIGR02145 family)